MNSSSAVRNLILPLALLVTAASAARAYQFSPHLVLDSARSLQRDTAKSGRLPDQVSIAMPDGGDTTLTTGHALLIFGEALGELARSGRLPGSITVAANAPARVNNVPRGSPNRGAVVSVAALGQQCRALGEVSQRMGGLPIAVWVDGRRLTLAEFFSAVIAALSAAAEQGRPPARVVIVAATPPGAWTGGAAAGWRVIRARALTGEGEQPEPLNPAGGQLAVPPQPEPRPLTLSLADGATVSGSIVLRADTWPDPRMIILAIDGRQRALLNVRPYQFAVDTRALDNGPHRFRVEAYGSSHGVEAVEITLTVANE